VRFKAQGLVSSPFPVSLFDLAATPLFSSQKRTETDEKSETEGKQGGSGADSSRQFRLFSSVSVRFSLRFSLRFRRLRGGLRAFPNRMSTSSSADEKRRN